MMANQNETDFTDFVSLAQENSENKLSTVKNKLDF